MSFGTKIGFIEAHIEGETARIKVIVAGLPDVDKQYIESGKPSWTGTFGLKRHLFNWLCRFGRVYLYVRQPESGVYEFRVKSFFLKGWSVVVTPELLYLMSTIIFHCKERGCNDILFYFRGREMFLPFELHDRFTTCVYSAIAQHQERVLSVAEALQPVDDAVAEGKDEAPKKVERVLH